MSVSLPKYIPWCLGIISVLISCYGVKSSAAFTDSNSPGGLSCPGTEAPAAVRSLDQHPPVNLPEEYPRSISSELPSPTGTGAGPAPEVQPDRESWPLQCIQAVPPVYEPANSPPVLVAVLDTGIDGSHVALSGKVVAETSMVQGADCGDRYGHGTAVAGIIAADAENGLGINGLAAGSRLINVKVADDNGRCLDGTVAEGIVWAIDNGARVINISLEIKEPTSELEDAVDYAWAHGAVIIAAAGNDGGSLPVYPAAFPNCISVTAIKEDGGLAPLANHGDWVDVAAPGYDIYTTMPGNRFDYKYGTSFAAAYVSGLAALLFPLATDKNSDGHLNDEVRQAIYAGCHNTGAAGAGRGLINVANSIDIAEMAR